jgi:poly(A)-specific ribonuclease
VAFDCEFTGAQVNLCDKAHEYDSQNDKYRKNKKAVENFVALQIGLTTFKWCGKEKKYLGKPFNFQVYPRSQLRNSQHMFSVSEQLQEQWLL